MALTGDEELLLIPFRWFILVTAGLPTCALFICISLSLALHLDEATRTHCSVVNYLPSISSANLLLTSPLRPLNDRIWFEIACSVACFINVAENIFLLLLTSVSSTENYRVFRVNCLFVLRAFMLAALYIVFIIALQQFSPSKKPLIHKISFTGFAVSSIIYMYFSTGLFKYSGRRRTSSLGEKSFQYKVLLCSTSTFSLISAVYFFYRHNSYCEPGMYTLFAISEYAVVLSIILFQCTLIFDFHGKHFTLTSSGVNFHYQPLLPTFDANKRSA